MKKGLLLLGAIALILGTATSCKKCYTCTFDMTVEFQGQSSSTAMEVEACSGDDLSRKELKDWVKEVEDAGGSCEKN